MDELAIKAVYVESLRPNYRSTENAETNQGEPRRAGEETNYPNKLGDDMRRPANTQDRAQYRNIKLCYRDDR